MLLKRGVSRPLVSRRTFVAGMASTLALPRPSVGAERLVLTGSSTIAPLALEVAKRFEKLNPGVRVDVQSGGSSRGITDARKGLADIGMVSRALHASEADLTAHTIAMDGVALIVHKSNLVAALADTQVKAIYTGQVSDWQQVGGPGGAITVVNKAEGRSTLELFLHYFGLKPGEVRAHVVIGENQQGIKTVAGNPLAIGYVSIGTAESEASLGTPIRLLPMNGVEAATASVRNGRFPLSRPLNLVTTATPKALAREFIAFAQSPAVHDLVKDAYFVPLATP